jgi:CBS domain-containing membrane protein
MLKSISKWFVSVFPTPGSIDRFEKMRACAGALFGIVLTGLCSFLLLGSTAEAAWLIAPMGASAVLLFAVPASPLAQPWSIMGGNIVAAIVGVTCARLMDEPIVAAALAVAMSIAAMFALRCLHPPGGTVALTAVLGGPTIEVMGYSFVLLPVGLNSLLLLLTALFFNNATGRRYPHIAQHDHENKHETKDLVPTDRLGITTEDLDLVLARYNQVLDISRDDLESILLETEMLAYRRRYGVIRCADIMSKDILSVKFDTELQNAWNLLHEHHVSALPVLDRAHKVIGMITKSDFIVHATHDTYEGFVRGVRRLLQPVRHAHSIKPEVVGQIMHKNVHVAFSDQPIVELVPLMSNDGLHSVPVVDDRSRLVGMITPSDMIAALYESSLKKPLGASIVSSLKRPVEKNQRA